MIPALVIFGPTASGKTAFLESLFASGRVRAEIVSADSMQVYRGMDIGTAKPSTELRRRLPHHLIDIRNPDEQFNVGEFVKLAAELCRDIAARGKLPVISGGAGFYIRNFVLGLSEAPPSDPVIREALLREAETAGTGALFGELQAADPVSAGRIHPNDIYRIVRALEVFRLSGRPLSEFRETGAKPWGEFLFYLAGIRRDREELRDRIAIRCREMFGRGLPDEVETLVKKGYRPGDPGMKAIGYREFFTEDGKFALPANTDGIMDLIVRNSCRYAKRQMTFFRSLPEIHWIEPDPETFLPELEKFTAWGNGGDWGPGTRDQGV